MAMFAPVEIVRVTATTHETVDVCFMFPTRVRGACMNRLRDDESFTFPTSVLGAVMYRLSELLIAMLSPVEIVMLYVVGPAGA
jgi:hypothetical protein